MPYITDENDNLVEVEISVKQSTLNRIFELATMIDQIEIQYQEDPLAMANGAIHLMQQYACEIASLAGYHE